MNLSLDLCSRAAGILSFFMKSLSCEISSGSRPEHRGVTCERVGFFDEIISVNTKQSEC